MCLVPDCTLCQYSCYVLQGRIREPFTLINGTLSTSGCQDCSDIYHQLNDVYLSLEMQYTNTVCADTVKVVISLILYL